MTSFQVPISLDYCPTWDLKMAVREFLQNALDAQDGGKKMVVTHNSKSNVLFIESHGVKLPRSVWLLGETTKRDTTARGQYGEGLKIGVLAALRAGHHVIITNDDEHWVPSIKDSALFDRKVLEVEVQPVYKSGTFMVSISNVTAGDWSEISSSFLALQPAQNTISNRHGSVLLGEAFRGCLFVKGIFVQKMEGVFWGYDLKTVRTDRDRKMVDQFDALHDMSLIWGVACVDEPRRVEEVLLPLLAAGSKEVEHFGLVCPRLISERVTSHFRAKWGQDAIGVATQSDAKEAGHYGKLGIVLPEAYRRIIQKAFGTLDQARMGYEDIIAEEHAPDSLTKGERERLEQAMKLVEDSAIWLGYRSIMDRTKVVTFARETVNGLHTTVGLKKTIHLARHLLVEDGARKLRRVLVHELAHDRGQDGEKEHEVAEGQLHVEIQESLLARLELQRLETEHLLASS